MAVLSLEKWIARHHHMIKDSQWDKADLWELFFESNYEKGELNSCHTCQSVAIAYNSHFDFLENILGELLLDQFALKINDCDVNIKHG